MIDSINYKNSMFYFQNTTRYKANNKKYIHLKYSKQHFTENNIAF